MTSLDTLLALDPQPLALLPGHGPPIVPFTRQEQGVRPVQLIQQYIDHRNARISQVRSPHAIAAHRLAHRAMAAGALCCQKAHSTGRPCASDYASRDGGGASPASSCTALQTELLLCRSTLASRSRCLEVPTPTRSRLKQATAAGLWPVSLTIGRIARLSLRFTQNCHRRCCCFSRGAWWRLSTAAGNCAQLLRYNSCEEVADRLGRPSDVYEMRQAPRGAAGGATCDILSKWRCDDRSKIIVAPFTSLPEPLLGPQELQVGGV
jgi:hypothetical protein